MANCYSFGWVPSTPDINDSRFAFVARSEVLNSLPSEVDLSDDLAGSPWNPVWQQGSIGSCGPHSAAADIVFAQIRQDGAAIAVKPSILFSYWVTRKLMGTVNSDSGVDNRSLLKGLNKVGWCDEALWPYDEGRFRDEPPAECFEQAATRKIEAYRSVPQVLEQMKACLAGGDPFIFGFAVYQSMLTAAVERTGEIPMPRLLEKQVGGHDVLMVGYSDQRRAFKLRNSWGDWGNGGYGWVPYEYAVNSQLASDFWTVQHSALTTPPAPPSPPPLPGPVGAGVITINLDTRHANLPKGWSGSVNK